VAGAKEEEEEEGEEEEEAPRAVAQSQIHLSHCLIFPTEMS
jgi:hypothetical protein